ncbi:aminotransferase class V-fold PLP-dependent enzyme [bacterium]|nr:aminotransferase class V-fold PLP-dependent enzyme [bacterium]
MSEHLSSELVYLDNAATSFPKPEGVYDAVNRFIRENAGSPTRGIGEGSDETNRLLDLTRRRLASFLGIRKAERLIFTYSATDGLSTVLFGLLDEGDHVLITPLEHNSVLRPLDMLASEKGVMFNILPHDYTGRVYADSIRDLVRPNTRLIAISMVSNVLGTIQPYKEICEVGRKLGIPVLLDGAQAAGHIPIELDKWGAAFFACPGHKAMLGLQGTGILYVNEDYTVRPLRVGGTGYLSESMKHPTAMPQYYESGTINMPGVASLSAGLDFIESFGLEKIDLHVTALAARLISGLMEIPGVVIYGPKDTKDGHGGVVSFNIGEHNCTTVGEILAGKYRIANRVGFHCAPLTHRLVGTLDRGGTVRLSIGVFNAAEHIEKALAAVQEIATTL